MAASVQKPSNEAPRVRVWRVKHTRSPTLQTAPAMRKVFILNVLPTIALFGLIAVGAVACKPKATVETCAAPTPSPAPRRPDLSGSTRFGIASFYAKEFAHRKMADGIKMNPHGDNAASKTLPLGTTAKVTDMETGKSAVVSIQDRGPYVKGRIVDLSPATARKIGITRKHGIAKVTVAPILVPLPDGRLKPGADAPDAKPCVPARLALESDTDMNRSR